MKIAVVDVDDLWCEEQITKWLVPLKEKVPALVVTCYAVPNKLGDVRGLRKRYPWIAFAAHGFEHVPFECQCWTPELCETNLNFAESLGYLKLFKPPNWRCHPGVEQGCLGVGFTLHHHDGYAPVTPGLLSFPGPPGARERGFVNIHSHIQRNPVTDHISTNKYFEPDLLGQFQEFKTPLDFAVPVP